MAYQIEFPDFDTATMPEIPRGFVDATWHNDVCPCFVSDELGLELWIDFSDAANREYPEWPRFRVSSQNHGVECSGPYFESDDWAAVLAFIAAQRATE